MRINFHQVLIGILLLMSSAVIYYLSIFLFKQPGTTLFYIVQDIAFIPLQILIVTLILDRLLSNREKNAILQKLNMVIGVFFGEMGNYLIRSFLDMDEKAPELRDKILLIQNWDSGDLKQFQSFLKSVNTSAQTSGKRLEALKKFLLEKRGFLLELMGNPNLLEHERFSQLLWAVFHLTEELQYRSNVLNLTAPDRKHVENDILRADQLLILEWVYYMRHLKSHYPYLFSLAVRLNPFLEHPSAAIKQNS